MRDRLDSGPRPARQGICSTEISHDLMINSLRSSAVCMVGKYLNKEGFCPGPGRKIHPQSKFFTQNRRYNGFRELHYRVAYSRLTRQREKWVRIATSLATITAWRHREYKLPVCGMYYLFGKVNLNTAPLSSFSTASIRPSWSSIMK